MGCPRAHLPRFQGKNRFWFFYTPHICSYLYTHTYNMSCRQGSVSLATLAVIWEDTGDAISVNKGSKGVSAYVPTLAQMGYSASDSHRTALWACLVYCVPMAMCAEKAASAAALASPTPLILTSDLPESHCCPILSQSRGTILEALDCPLKTAIRGRLTSVLSVNP